MRYFLFALLFVASTVHADIGPKNANVTTGTLIAGLGMGASRSFSLGQVTNGGTFGLLNVYISLADANDSVTNLRMTCTTSLDGNSTNYKMEVCSIPAASGTCTSYDATWNYDPSTTTTPKRWAWRVDIEGWEDIQCTFAPTGGAAVDLLTVTGMLAVKGS